MFKYREFFSGLILNKILFFKVFFSVYFKVRMIESICKSKLEQESGKL